MDMETRMQEALKPLDNQGLVYMVVLPDEPVPPLAIVFLNADDPESYRPEIEYLLKEAGLTKIEVALRHNPMRIARAS
jgi:hypothetical protein